MPDSQRDPLNLYLINNVEDIVFLYLEVFKSHILLHRLILQREICESLKRNHS